MRKLSSVSLLMCALVCLFFYQVHASFDIFINYGQPLRSVSNQLPFICVTMDWWPDNKCDSPDGQSDCAWIGSSVLNARIAPSSRLAAALAALGNVTLRIGGTLADSITYAAGADVDISCPGFTPPATAEKSKTFTGGCLREARWREVLDFCDDATGCKLVMGLNGMRGRSCKRHFDQSHEVCFDAYETCDDDWDSSNAEALVNATASKQQQKNTYSLSMRAWSTGSFKFIYSSVCRVGLRHRRLRIRERIGLSSPRAV